MDGWNTIVTLTQMNEFEGSDRDWIVMRLKRQMGRRMDGEIQSE